MTTAESAILKIGGKMLKDSISVTVPKTARSMRLPTPPEAISASEILRSVALFLFLHKNIRAQTTTTADMRISSCLCPLKELNAAPSF